MSAVPTAPASPAATATVASLRNLQAAAPREAQLPAVSAGFFDLQGFELLQRVAKAFASSTLVPQHYQGNVANCMIALNLARRLGADELMVMQNLYIVHGNPGWSAKFLIACVNTCGRYTSLRYEWRGTPGADDYGCRAWAIEKSTGERLNGAWVDWKMVKAEGWHSKNGSKWKTMPDQMFIYRSAAFWQRGYAPEISMGLLSAEELADVVDMRADGSFTVTTESLRTDMQTITDAEQMDADQAAGLDAAMASNPVESPEAPPADAAPRVSQAALIDKIRAANSRSDLELLGDLIRSLPVDQQDLPNEEFGRRWKALKDD